MLNHVLVFDFLDFAQVLREMHGDADSVSRIRYASRDSLMNPIISIGGELEPFSVIKLLDCLVHPNDTIVNHVLEFNFLVYFCDFFGNRHNQADIATNNMLFDFFLLLLVNRSMVSFEIIVFFLACKEFITVCLLKQDSKANRPVGEEGGIFVFFFASLELVNNFI